MQKKVVKYVCPTCGGSAKRVFFNRYRCKYCGNEFEIDREFEKYNEPQDDKESKIIDKAKNHTKQNEKENVKLNTKPYTKQNINENKKTLLAANTGVNLLIACIAIFSLFIIITIIYYNTHSNTKNKKNMATINPLNIQQDEPVKKTEYYDLPQHERGKQYASLIFGKPFSEITCEDLAKVRYIKLDYTFDSNTTEDITQLQYSFENYEDYEDYAEFEKTIQTIEIYESNLEKDYDTLDIACFKNLTYMDIGSGRNNVYGGLKQLSGVSIYDDEVEKLAEEVDPLQIKAIDLYVSSISEFDYKQLAQFKNLERLEINDRDMTAVPDILKSFKNLKSLYIHDGEKIKNFNTIKDLKNLDNLELHRVKNLKDLSIISDLPLTTFFLESSAINNYNALENNTTIKRLTLHFNSEVSDITPISTMTGLEEFNTVVYSINGLDSLANLKNLKKLSLSTNGSTSIQFISSLDNLEELNMECCYLPNGFEFLSSLPKLKKMNVFAMASSNYYKDLDHIASLEDLTITNGEHDSTYIEDLLSSNHLKKLTIKGGYVAFDLNQSYAGSSIEDLTLKNIKYVI